MSQGLSRAVGHDELAALKLLGLEGCLDGEVKASCAALADRLDSSNQTASRRLQSLDDAGLLTRETVADGQWIAITDAGERALHREYESYRRLFEGRSSVTLDGTVTGGMGEGRHYISLSGYMRQFEERLGYEPFPGTLNVALTDESVRRRGVVDSFEPIPIEGWEDDDRTYGPAVCYPARVESVEHDSVNAEGEHHPRRATGVTYEGAHVIAPERTHHDEDQIELIAPDKLRDELDLADGDELLVHIEEPA